MKRIAIILFVGSLFSLSSCKKIEEIYKPGSPTFSIKISPTEVGSASPTVTFTDKDSKIIQAQAISADGKTVISIVATDNLTINFVVEGTGAGIYAQHPIASMDGNSPKLSSPHPFATRDEDNVSIEILQYDAVGGRVKGTVNATCLHTIDYDSGETEVLSVHGSFNIRRSS